MPHVATIPAARPTAGARPQTRRLSLSGVIAPLATAVTLLGIAVALVLPPILLHPLLDAAGSHLLLGISTAEAHRLSDLTVTELVFGPGSFAFTGPSGGPMFDAAEIAHLRDARTLLWMFLTAAALSGLAAIMLAIRTDARLALIRVARGGAVLVLGVAVLGLVALIAFGPAFEAFHVIFFPGGNWAFSATQRLVQLYPFAFWQLVSGLVAICAASLGLATWFTARRLGRRLGSAVAAD
ncbi:hypothetical protein BH18CHL1_BH18CHL1_00060 [soil metagenome]